MIVLVVGGCSSRLERTDEAAKETEAPQAARPALQLETWAKIHAVPYGIPVIALESYAYAASVMDHSAPGCHIGWPTVAALGSVESDHGRTGGAKMDDAANVKPALRAVSASPGAPAPSVSDTDGGRFDGDNHVDLPMGPMQFYPSKWEQWSTDANNDGTANPDNMDDAALSAARFLCASGGDLTSAEGWTKAVSAYNPAPEFVSAVHERTGLYSR